VELNHFVFMMYGTALRRPNDPVLSRVPEVMSFRANLQRLAGSHLPLNLESQPVKNVVNYPVNVPMYFLTILGECHAACDGGNSCATPTVTQETWTDATAEAAHRGGPNVAAAFAAVGTLLAGPPEIHQYTKLA
jgi:hypothetical protein